MTYKTSHKAVVRCFGLQFSTPAGLATDMDDCCIIQFGVVVNRMDGYIFYRHLLNGKYCLCVCVYVCTRTHPHTHKQYLYIYITCDIVQVFVLCHIFYIL